MVASAPGHEVVFSRLSIPDGDHPLLEGGVWAPATLSDTPRPLIIISHGNGGDFRSHHDTATALTQAGYIVASITHTGDNWRDQSRATDLTGRSRHLSRLIDFMTNDWQARATIDPQRIGAFGFSAGGFTVLATAGGKPDLGRLTDHCRTNPDFYDCRLIARHGTTHVQSPGFTHDPRLKAISIAAPALGFSFTRSGLSTVTQPVQLWQASQDQILPAPFYVEPVRDNLPSSPDFQLVDGASHFDFLPPCTPQLAANAPLICSPTPGFDRARFHDRLNTEIIRFFDKNL